MKQKIYLNLNTGEVVIKNSKKEALEYFKIENPSTTLNQIEIWWKATNDEGAKKFVRGNK